jgi:DNA-binding cell septation regulator SpoVG
MSIQIISEIQIIPVKANKGLIAFCSFVLYEAIYCSSVGIYTRPQGGYRLVYPTKKVNETNLNIFHPINSKIGKVIEEEVSKEAEKVLI